MAGCRRCVLAGGATAMAQFAQAGVQSGLKAVRSWTEGAATRGKLGTLHVFTRLRFWCRDVIFRGFSQLISESQSSGQQLPLPLRERIEVRG